MKASSPAGAALLRGVGASLKVTPGPFPSARPQGAVMPETRDLAACKSAGLRQVHMGR